MKRRDFIKSTTLSFISVGAVSSLENANAEMVRGRITLLQKMLK